MNTNTQQQLHYMTLQSGKQHLKMLDIGLSQPINITIAQSVTLFKHMVESVMVQELAP